MSATDLGDPDRIADALGDAADAADDVADDGDAGGGSGGLLDGINLGPLGSTDPNPDLDQVDDPDVSRSTARRFAYRAFLKIQGARGATALFDLIAAGVIMAIATLREPGEPGEDADARGDAAGPVGPERGRP